MAKNYEITSFDEGKLTAVVTRRGGVAVVDGNVTHVVLQISLQEYLANYVDDENRQKTMRDIEAGKIFERTAQGKNFVFDPIGYGPIPLDTFIIGSEETARVDNNAGIAMLKEGNRTIAKKYGFNANPFHGEWGMVNGLKELKRLQQSKLEDIPIIELKPMKPLDRGSENSKGSGRQRQDEEN